MDLQKTARVLLLEPGWLKSKMSTDKCRCGGETGGPSHVPLVAGQVGGPVPHRVMIKLQSQVPGPSSQARH